MFTKKLKAFFYVKRILPAAISIFILLGCNPPTSLTNVSISDNKSFQKKGYASQTPVRPFGNLSGVSEYDDESADYYMNLTKNGYFAVDENERYFLWLAAQQRRKKELRERNEFYAEAMPSMNNYYIKKSRIASKSGGTLNYQRYKDIERQIVLSKEKVAGASKREIEDDIADYNIHGYIPASKIEVEVEEKDYD